MTPQEFAAKWRNVELEKHTLTKLYNQRPTWFELAHQKLDHAVLDAYGWPPDPSAGSGLGISDEEIWSGYRS
jgi:hypothetical protein